jgi:hypothetical protein
MFESMIFFKVSICCFGVITSFFLDVSVSIPYNVTMGNATTNWTEIINGTFTGISGNTPAGISELFYSNLYPNYKQVTALLDKFSGFILRKSGYVRGHVSDPMIL